MHQQSYLLDTGLILTLLFFSAYFLKSLKFPYIVSFMLSGLISKFILPYENLEFLAVFEHSAVAILFFFVGLEYSFERLVGMLRVIKPGIIDFLVNFFPVFIMTYLISKDLFLSLILASALYPSSTAITVKLFMDYKRIIYPEFDLLVGVLIFEDLISIILLSLLSGISEGFDFYHLFKTLLVLPLSFSLFYILVKFSKGFFEFLDKKLDENLFIYFILGFLLLISGLSTKLGISEALFAFLLGVLIPENTNIYKRIEKNLFSFKEISLGVFFFFFTYKIQAKNFDFLSLSMILTLLIILSKVISTYIGSRMYGLSPRVSLRSSLSFIQRGEFSLIISSLYPPSQGIVFLAVLITSVLGSFSFVLAPRVVKRKFHP